MTGARLQRAIPILDVQDMDDTLGFYVDRLGFEVEFRWAEEPSNYAGVRRGDVYLHLQWQHEEHFRQGSAGRSRVRLLVDDPDALFAEFQRTGALNDAAQIRDTPWGTREFGLRDPNGNGLIFCRDL